jgi:hypothetical protein
MVMAKIYTTEIECWWYEEDGIKGNSFQVVVTDDFTGKVAAKGPLRDTRIEAEQDERELRSGKQHVKDWQKGNE